MDPSVVIRADLSLATTVCMLVEFGKRSRAPIYRFVGLFAVGPLALRGIIYHDPIPPNLTWDQAICRDASTAKPRGFMAG
jgi:hypothetical protein